MKTPGHTPPFRAPNGSIVPDSVATVEYLRIGGIDQWVMIRGENVANPVLVVLHGGPGMSETAFYRCYNAVLEKWFTVVYWDQRGAGKSYDPAIPRASMTTEQFLRDLDELVDLVRARFTQPKVIVFGHSWGSILGMLYAKRCPDKVAAYVGTGQVAGWPEGEAVSYRYALSEAERTGRRSLVERLRRIGPPPYSAASLWEQRMCLTRVDGSMKPRALWKLAKMILGAKESSIFELPRAYRAFRWTLDVMWDEVSRIDLEQQVPGLAVPVVFMLGRNDHWATPDLAAAYFEKLSAPSKQLLWFEKSGHEPFVDEPDKFNAAMVELVRPLAGPGRRAAA
jgi:pimeloyl-ACP methyl ester carboxylesterase